MVPARLVILYGSGGLSDVGRHAVQAALERTPDAVSSIKVLTQHPEMLDEPDWKCGCEQPHSFTDEQRSCFVLVTVKSWKEDDLNQHFQGATAVISCLGNRQPFIGDWVAEEGNKAVIRGMNANNVSRVAVLSSVGIEEDWPPCEFHSIGKNILSGMFLTISRRSFKDLTKMERAYRASDLDYLIVRPVGIGEEAVPVNKWYLQKQKHVDVLGANMAKLDVARYMVEEALNPTRHKEAVVIGAEPPADGTK